MTEQVGERVEDEGLDPAAVLAALANPRRADIVRLLEQRHRSQTGLCRDLEMSQPLLSHHLKVLGEARIVESTWCERTKMYQLRPETLHALEERIAVMARRAEDVASHRPC